MNVRRFGLCGVAALAAAALLWTALRPGLPGAPGQAAAQGGEVKAGKYKFVSGGNTVVMIDTTTGQTWALTSAGGGMPMFGMGGGGEHAWVTIVRFDDVEKYRKWAKERRDEMMKGMPFPGGGGPLGPPPGGKFEKKEIEKKEEAIQGEIERRRAEAEAARRRALEDAVRKLQEELRRRQEELDKQKQIRERGRAERQTARVMKVSLTAGLPGQFAPSFVSVYPFGSLAPLSSLPAPRRK
jgi:hypothetical protein